MNNAWDQIKNLVWNVFNRPTIADVLDIFIVAYLIYKLLMLTKETRASAVLKGLVMLIAASWISDLLGLTALSWVLQNVVANGAVVLVILFQPVFCSSLHTEIIKYQQRVAAKAGNILIPALKAGGKVIEYRCKVCHADGNLFFHKGVGDTGGKVAFSRPHAAPKQVADIFSLHGFPALHIKTGGCGLRVSAVVMLKCPVPHSRVGKAPAFQVLHFFKVLLSAFGGLLLFTGCSLAVAVCWVAVTLETGLSLCKVGFFGRMALAAV